METIKFKWCPKGGFIEAVEAFLNPYFYLIDRDPKSKWDGWETRKIQSGTKVIEITIRAKEVDYDKARLDEMRPWLSYNSVKYEVKPNKNGIEQILFLKDKGWFAIGEKLALWRV